MSLFGGGPAPGGIASLWGEMCADSALIAPTVTSTADFSCRRLEGQKTGSRTTVIQTVTAGMKRTGKNKRIKKRLKLNHQ